MSNSLKNDLFTDNLSINNSSMNNSFTNDMLKQFLKKKQLSTEESILSQSSPQDKDKKKKTNRTTRNLFVQLSAQDILYILEALSVYQQLVLPEIYRPAIDDTVNAINSQLELQGINLYKSINKKNILIGSKCTTYDVDNCFIPANVSKSTNDKSDSCKVVVNDIHAIARLVEGVVIGASDIDGLIKVAISQDDKMKIIEVPYNSIILANGDD